jgi:hypothetical protein
VAVIFICLYGMDSSDVGPGLPTTGPANGRSGLRFDCVSANRAMHDARWRLNILDPVDHRESGEVSSSDDGMGHAQPHPAADAHGNRGSLLTSDCAVVTGHYVSTTRGQPSDRMARIRIRRSTSAWIVTASQAR